MFEGDVNQPIFILKLLFFRMDNNEQKLTAFLQQVKQQAPFPQCIRQNSKKYEINTSQLLKLHPDEILRLKTIIITKRQGEQEFKEKLETQWNQCEKKVFNWIALCYAHMHCKNLEELSDPDLEYLSSITTEKSLPLIKYHICTLLKQENRPKWSERQDKILHQILAVQKKFKTQGEWILVSKELFLRGDLKMYKSAKNCRERWFNHVDPGLCKEWTVEEDKIMLQSVKKEGKKWAYISSKLNHTKNQHMIKNRFYSLIKKQQKNSNQDLQEEDLANNILKKLKSQQSNIQTVPQKIEQQKNVKTQIKEERSGIKEVKQQVHEMKLISSFNFHPLGAKELAESQLVFVNKAQELDSNKIFKQQPQEKDGKQLWKSSQIYSYNNYVYPSPAPVTPGFDLNLFNESQNLSLEPTLKSNFQYNLTDFTTKNAQ